MGAILNRLLQETNIYKYCHNCISWIWDKNIKLDDGSVAYVGHCGLLSGQCINAVADKTIKPPPRFIHMEEPVE